MDHSIKASFIIKGSKLLPCRENHFNFHLDKSRFQIIKGTVYRFNDTHCAHAVVEVTQIDGKNHTRKLLGYTITDENGRYLLSLEAIPGFKYELSVYAPLITTKKEGLS